MRGLLEQLIDTPEAAEVWIDRPTADQSAEIAADIQRINEHIAKLTAGINKADIDYYSHGALDEDAPRHQAIVSALKKQIATAQAEITTLQDKLHAEQHRNQATQRIDDMRANGLAYLDMEDTRTANAWLRQRFQVYVEQRRVSRIVPLF